MAKALNITAKRISMPSRINGIAAAYILLGLVTLHSYLSFLSAGFMLGALAVVMILQVSSRRERSHRYLGLVLLSALLCAAIPVKTLLYFAICAALIFFRESFYGKTSILLPATMLFASPVFQYIGNTFSFPIRMQLTRLSGQLLQLSGYSADVQGNMIVLDGNEFSVDPACMGLSMITTSLLLGVILLALYQWKGEKQMRSWRMILYLLVVLGFNIIANLFRILLLVVFNVPASNAMHDIIGLACLLFYVFIPAVALASFLARISVDSVMDGSVANSVSRKSVLLHLLVFASLLILAWRVHTTDTFSRFVVPPASEVPGYTVQLHSPGIVKVENTKALIYVKYLRGFYDTEHSPMLCWSGSGYRFERVVKENIGGLSVFTARLVYGDEVLYAAWWYDNGRKQTTDQWEWRRDLIKGSAPYAILNVTCDNKEDLEREIQKIVNQRALSAFFSH